MTTSATSTGPGNPDADRALGGTPTDLRVVRTGELPAIRQPPWLWLYLALAVTLVIPSGVTTLRDEWAQLEPAGAVPVPDVWVLRLLTVATTVPSAFLVAAALVAVLPRLRRALVERYHPPYDAPPGPAREVQDAVQQFVDRHATGIEVRLTAGAGDLARIYPTGYRRARIAVFAPFLPLWRDHRRAAETLLLHEIAHRRQGEHLILGMGSPFGWLARIWGLAFAALSVLPVAVLALHHSVLGTAAAPQLARDSTQPLRLLLLPVAALWLAELAADDWAARVHGRDPLLAALAPSGRPGARGPRPLPPLPLLDHPPLRLRRALAGSRPHPAVMLICWPAVILLHFVVAAATTIPVSLLAGWSVADQPAVLAHGAGVALRSAVPGSIGCLLLLVGWPVLSRRWPRLWAPGHRTGAVRRRREVRPPAAGPYLLAAVLPALLLLGAVVPAPELPVPGGPHDEPVVTVPKGIAPGGDLVVRVTQVLEFTDAGTPADRSRAARQALLASTWTLSADGRFGFDAPGLPRADYPLTGRWQSSGTRVTVIAESTGSTGSIPDGTGARDPASAGRASVSITGSLDSAGHPPTMTLQWMTTGPAPWSGTDDPPPVPTFEFYRATVQVSTRSAAPSP